MIFEKCGNKSSILTAGRWKLRQDARRAPSPQGHGWSGHQSARCTRPFCQSRLLDWKKRKPHRADRQEQPSSHRRRGQRTAGGRGCRRERQMTKVPPYSSSPHKHHLLRDWSGKWLRMVEGWSLGSWTVFRTWRTLGRFSGPDFSRDFSFHYVVAVNVSNALDVSKLGGNKATTTLGL